MKLITISPISFLLGALTVGGLVVVLGAQEINRRTAVEIPSPLATSNGIGQVRVLGLPAPDEWLDIESNTQGAPHVTYTVPAGKTFTLDSVYNRASSLSGGLYATVFIDGVSVWGNRSFTSTPQSFGFPEGWVATEGQVVTVAMSGGSTGTFFLRGWLEDVP